MADLIRIKRNDVAGTQPAALDYGELAVNTTDKTLWVGTSANQVVLLNPQSNTTGVSSVPVGFKEQKLVVNKASIANTVAGQLHSMWRATGYPAQAAIPTAAALCNNATLGAMPFTNSDTDGKSYLANCTVRNTNSGTQLELMDRLIHLGGLVGNVTTAQTVNLDLNNFMLGSRVDSAHLEDVQWFMEWYTDTGSTATVATVNVTYSDGTTGNLSAISLAATRRASFLVQLNYYIPAAKAGLDIRAVNTVQLSVSTGTAGNFGVTAYRPITSFAALLGNYPHQVLYDAAQMPDIPNDACLTWMIIPATTATGALMASAQIVQGAAPSSSGVAVPSGSQMFTSSGTFVVPAGVTEIILSGVAHGGGGGQAQNQGAGGGGSSGQWILRKRFTVTAGSSHTVTIGSVSAPSSFGALQTLQAGYTGQGGDSNDGGFSAGGYGGQVSGGTPGTPGQPSFDTTAIPTMVNSHGGTGGNGGSSPFGAGGAGGTAGNNGTNATGYGAGGGGDGAYSYPVAQSEGSPAMFLVEW